MNPDLGFVSPNGQTYVKLYFKPHELSTSEVAVALHLMNDAVCQKLGVQPAILDVRRKRLHVPRKTTANPAVLLQSEAAAFMTIWNSL